MINLFNFIQNLIKHMMNLNTHFNVVMIEIVAKEIEDHGGNLPPQWANPIGRYTNNKKMEVT